MSMIKGFLIALVSLASSAAVADDVVGIVRAAGGGPLSKTYLETAPDGAGPTLCASDNAKRVRRLGGLTVKVAGEWKLNKDGKQDCLEIASVKVLKVAGGREAHVGTLKQTNGSYRIEAEDGKSTPLARVTSGLKKIEGKQVILDLKVTESPGGGDAAYGVVSYSEFPR